jgi:hypothetical protein
MARRVRTLPIASASEEPKFEINTTDWPRIESAYGHALPQSTRDEILKLTTSFVHFAPFETTAEPLKAARDMAIAWKRAAANLQHALHGDGCSDALVFAKRRVRMHFIDARDARFVQRPHFFEDLSGVLTSFIVACNKAVADMDDPGLPELRQGERWENWVRSLTRTLDEAGLPTGARKDSADLVEKSAFTNLVAALQNLAPAKIRRSTQSLSALAKAVQRARTIPGTGHSTPPVANDPSGHSHTAIMSLVAGVVAKQLDALDARRLQAAVGLNPA